MTATTKAKTVITTTPQEQPETYVGRQFPLNGRVFQVWKYTQPVVHQTRTGELQQVSFGTYNAVALIDPTQPISTKEYHRIDGKPVHTLENVDPNTHFVIPSNRIKSVLADPSILVDEIVYPNKVSANKPKKIIKLKREITDHVE